MRQGALVEVEVGRVVRAAPARRSRAAPTNANAPGTRSEELAEVLAAHRPAGRRDASRRRRTRAPAHADGALGLARVVHDRGR